MADRKRLTPPPPPPKPVSAFGPVAYDPNEKMWMRKGVLGHPEYAVPDNWGGEEYRGGKARAMVEGQKAFFFPGWFNDPTGRTHEAIHVAQNRMETAPTVEQLMTAFGGAAQSPPVAVDRKYWDSKRARWITSELPAYALTQAPKPVAQAAYDKYLEILQTISPQSAFNMEVAVPEWMAKSNLKRKAPKYLAKPPKVDMKEVPVE